MIKPTYNISDKVYHITPESELGIVIDASYSLLTGRWLYQVTFSPHTEALWYHVHELSTNKTY